MQVCTSIQIDNHASTPPLSFFTGRMPFLPPNQQRQSTEGQTVINNKCYITSLSVQLPTSADSVTLLAFAAERQPCSSRSISPAHRAHSSKPAAAACGGPIMGRMDRRTDARKFHRPCSAYYASSVNNIVVIIRPLMRPFAVGTAAGGQHEYSRVHGQRRKQMSGFLTKLE